MTRAKVLSFRTDSGDPSGFTALARRAGREAEELRQLVENLESHPRLRALATSLARPLHPHGPDDLMQCTLERVVRGIRSFRADGDLLGWVSRIMRNVQIELLRKEASEQAKRIGYGADPGRAGSDDPADLLGREQLRHFALIAWTRTVHDPDVRLLWDRVYSGVSVEQIMRKSGEPRSTVYSKLKRGVEKLAFEFRRLTTGGSL